MAETPLAEREGREKGGGLAAASSPLHKRLPLRLCRLQKLSWQIF
jgi:hypothetical protein